MDALNAARKVAREAAARVKVNIETAADFRDTAALALEARLSGELTTADLIDRYEQITTLDPGVHWDWVQLGRLYTDAGDLSGARDAALQAAETAKDDRDRSVSLDALGNVATAQGDLPAARSAYEAGLAIFERLVARDPGNAAWQNDLSVSYERIGGVATAQGDLSAAHTAYQQSLVTSLQGLVCVTINKRTSLVCRCS